MARGSARVPKIPVFLLALASTVLLLVFKSQDAASFNLGNARPSYNHLLEAGNHLLAAGRLVGGMASQDGEEDSDEESSAEETIAPVAVIKAGGDLVEPIIVETPTEVQESTQAPAQDKGKGKADGTSYAGEPGDDRYAGEPGEEDESESSERDHSIVHKAPGIPEPRDLLKEPLGCKASGPAPVHFQKHKKGKRPCGARINFLFMVLDRILHVSVWKAFFAQAPESSYRVFVHCKKECDPEMFISLPMLKKVSRKPTTRCLDLVTAEAQLVKTALKSYISGAEVLQKYAILTDSTLPVKPFSVVYDTVLSHRESDFCFFNDAWWPKTHLQYVKLSPTKVMLQRGGKKASLLVKHSQFAILNRADAETFSKNWKPVNRTQPVSFKVPLKSDRWTKGLRFVMPPEVPSFAFNHHRDKDIPFAGMCADEFALFSTLYGTFEKDEFGVQQCPLNYSRSCSKIEELIQQKRCYTMSIAGHGNRLIKDLKADAGSKVSFGSHGHPSSFSELSTKSMQRLRYSEFMFARKFNVNASIVDYVNIVFNQ